MVATVISILVVPGALAFTAVTLLARRTLPAIIAGALLVVVTGLTPMLFAYAWSIAAAGGVIGACAAAIWSGRAVEWPRRAVLAGAVVVLAAEPVVVLDAALIGSEERYDRCAAEEAVTVIEQSRAQGRGYPADMNEIALSDGEYGSGCYVSRGVNWLYRVGVPGTYTLGYWVDWHAARRVCLHAARSQGWTCGFEAWGPFRPGEVD